MPALNPYVAADLARDAYLLTDAVSLSVGTAQLKALWNKELL